MVFENLTMVELHIHESAEEETTGDPTDQTTKRIPVESGPEAKSGPSLKKIGAMVLGSVIVSVVVAVLASRGVEKVKSKVGGSKNETEESEEAVVEINE